jgi:hypothetical protein
MVLRDNNVDVNWYILVGPPINGENFSWTFKPIEGKEVKEPNI